MSGRFAPSPTGDLHLGNLRTALLAWLAARSSGLEFIVRMEDLDRVQAAPEHERCQLGDLGAIGLDWDGEVIRQSERFDIYRDALSTLRRRGLVYECFCSRREIRAEIESAPSAPHLPPGSYPGTCREMSSVRRQQLLDEGRPPALRLNATGSTGHSAGDWPATIEFDDILAGHRSGGVDDVVLRRNDGVPAYNLAVVIDDAMQGVTQVVRGDDLLDSTPRQIHLQRLLDLPTPTYGHVPLVLGQDGERLSKRHGSVTLSNVVAGGASVEDVVGELLRSCGVAIARIEQPDPTAAVDQFRLASIPPGVVTFESNAGEPPGFILRNTR